MQVKKVVIAMVVCLVLGGVVSVYRAEKAAEPIADQVIIDHGHWYDKHELLVKSTDDREIRRVLTPKLGFAPCVTNGGGEVPVELHGARIETVNGRPVAVLVYTHEQSTIELYEWPAPGHTESLTFPMDWHGNHLCRWYQAELQCWAVTPIAMDYREFRKVVGQLRARMGD